MMTDEAQISRRGLLAGLGAAAMTEMAGATQSAHAGDGKPRAVRGDSYRKKLLQCLGGEWPEGGPLQPIVEKTEQKDGYRLERITYLVEPHERIAAYLRSRTALRRAGPHRVSASGTSITVRTISAWPSLPA